MTTQSNAISGEVAKVISDREVALNVGREKGVEIGMLFDILVPGDLEIADPKTGEVLGRIERHRAKARVRVASLEDRFCIARTYRTEQVNVGGPDALPKLRGDLNLQRWITGVEKIRTHEAIDSGGLTESERFVAVGDPVMQVSDDDKNLSEFFYDMMRRAT